MNQQQSTNGMMATFWRAFKLDADFYAEAHQIPHIKRKAQILVGVAAFSHAVGSSIILLTYKTSLWLQALAFLINGLSIVAGYYGWTFTIWKLGGWLRSPIPPYKKLLSPVGLTYAPQVFNVFTVVPLLGRPIEIGLGLWSLIAAIVALHHGLNIKLSKAIVICAIGWSVVQVAIGVVQIGVQKFLEP